MRQVVLAIVAVLMALTVAAGEEESWRSWIDSPEAHFATEAERERWKGLEDADAARIFIEEYFASRGDEFREELRWRIGMADEHLSWKDQPGSTRLQGKLVILLGQPTSILKSNDSRFGRPHFGDRGMIPSKVSNVSLDDTRIEDDLYTYRFSDERLLDLIEVEGALLVHVAVDTSTGEESIPDAKERKRLESIFRVIAEDSITRSPHD